MYESKGRMIECTCPDTWDCPRCVFVCEWCSDAKDEQAEADRGYKRERREWRNDSGV